MKELLKQIIFEQQDNCRHLMQDAIPRHIEEEWLTTSEILIITGVRRCGKSVLLQQLRDKLEEKDFFFNFDDERLVNFKLEDFATLQECFFELFGEQHTYYFDEIQNITGWETFVRRLYNEGNKVVVTGSNARMLSKEMGTHLTGRYISVEVYPFSFAEYLQLEHIEPSQKDFYLMASRSKLLGHFRDFLERGGFPKYLQTGSVSYLSSLYESIIFRDVMARNGLTNDKEIKELAFYLASNATKRVTYNSLGKIVGIRHPETIKNYLEYIQQTYMIFQLLKYAPSVKTQMLSPKKVYFIDNAIISRMGFNVTDNNGVKLENAVFIELLRRGYDLFYHADKKECDFVVREGVRITQAYQVTVKMDDEKTRKREIEGLQEAMERLDEAVHQIRNIVYRLRDEDASVGLVDAVEREATVARSNLGFAPTITFEVDEVQIRPGSQEMQQLRTRAPELVNESLSEDVVAVIRESLTNIARHAGAHSAQVKVSLFGAGPTGEIEVLIVDDGAGVDPSQSRSSGIANMQRRAANHGGSFAVGAGPRGRGTSLVWRSPLE